VLKVAEPLNLIFELRFHAQLVYVDLVKYFQQFSDELFLANVLVLAITVSRSSATVINVMRRRAVAQFLVLVLSRDAGLAQAACEELCESKFFIISHDLVTFELGLTEIEKVFRDNRLVFAVVPVAAFAWAFELPVIERVIEDAIYAAKCQRFVAPSFEVKIVLEPVVDFAPAPFLVGELLEHLLDDRGANRIDDDLAFLVH